MTAKERLHELVDGLSEVEAHAMLEFVVSRAHREETEEAEMLPLPVAWQTLPSCRYVRQRWRARLPRSVR